MSDATESDVNDQQLVELLSALRGEAGVLLRQEVALAKVEIREKVRLTATGAALLCGAALLAVLTAGAVTAAAVLGLAIVLPAWAAALVVASVEGVAGVILALRGRARIGAATPFTPERTVRTVRKDIEWARQQMSSAAASTKHASG
jgi:Putative Actinobacterial Holin-X, holin superfamily III